MFCVAVFALALAFMATSITTRVGWCDAAPKPGEAGETILVCVRNWANAVGNLIAALIAAGAAYFAFGSFAATRRQADLASLPSLETRIANVRDMIQPLRDVRDALHGWAHALHFCKPDMQPEGDEVRMTMNSARSLDGAIRALHNAGDNIQKTYDDRRYETIERLILTTALLGARDIAEHAGFSLFYVQRVRLLNLGKPEPTHAVIAADNVERIAVLSKVIDLEKDRIHQSIVRFEALYQKLMDRKDRILDDHLTH